MKQLVSILALLISHVSNGQEKTYKKLIPHHAKMQFAGTIGFVSAGVGYTTKKGFLDGDLYYGYVPKKYGGATMHSITGKVTTFPLRETKFLGLEVKPFAAGAFVSYTFGKQFFLFAPENYPYNYYGFPTALHGGVFIGGQAGTRFNKKSLRRIAVYYELGTTDKELKSYFGNNSIPFREILNLGVGIRTNF